MISLLVAATHVTMESKIICIRFANSVVSGKIYRVDSLIRKSEFLRPLPSHGRFFSLRNKLVLIASPAE